ncbi:protein DPH4 [Choanephora cucurbitarum]|uniref:Diphthamide biosynthesis protein 4 n=1 Tax=Choanephora cucurbitarum TaxID=101091 RepID=A0A1C7NEV2_9FUNG|nr:protein DPH4 [Choanephora cucurbitarum]
MSTHYEVLQVSETASFDLIKQRFQRLILQHHPDKRSENEDDTQAQRILKAWDVLRDSSSRKEYDIELEIQRNKKDMAISAEVDLDEMEYTEEEKTFSLVCRCSGEYLITEDELEEGIDVIGCNNCSLRIRVLYDVVDEEDA